MPIQSEDIKLLESAVMADVPEGGGAMTGVAIVDGQSNNIFPDTSTDDRAAGRVNLRKVFGVAHTDDTDTLLGASFAVLSPPEDPLVHISLFETSGWADERDVAQEQVERYLVKGPTMSCRIMDTHYAGTILLQLYQVGGSNFPVSGDAIVLRNPNGTEQYVRIIKVTLSTGEFTATEGSSTVSFAANVALCELGQALDFDLLGPPVARTVTASSYAQVYSTSTASGVAFYGVKPLGAAAAVGDRSVVADGGIYSPLVPAATVEEPLIDIEPLTARAGLARTAYSALALPGVAVNLTAGTVLRLPTSAEPGTLTMTHGGTTFVGNADGTLTQGTTVVGAVDHRARTVTMAAGSPAYGTATNSISYKPASISGAAVESDYWTVTTANQGLAWVYACEPLPAPGTFSLAYMAQGRWYELADNGAGKLVGADSSYGTGSINYTTGSVSATLGALPDVGSLLLQWGRTDAAVQAPASGLPPRIESLVPLPEVPRPGTLVVGWSRGGTPYSATLNADGSVTGPALIGPVLAVSGGGYAFTFAPATLPDGALAISYESQARLDTFTAGVAGAYTLSSTPVQAGSVRATLPLDNTGFPDLPSSALVYDIDGDLFALFDGWKTNARLVGSINYATGAISVDDALLVTGYWYRSPKTITTSAGSTLVYSASTSSGQVSVPILRDAITDWTYLSTGSGTPEAAAHAPTWRLTLRDTDAQVYLVNGVAIAVGGRVYTSTDGTLVDGWNHTTGAGSAAGAVSSDGVVTWSATPPVASNAVTYTNLAISLSADAQVFQGTYRLANAPIKAGSFQQQAGARVGQANDSGVITGGDFTGSVDFTRGIVRWSTLVPVDPAALTYNAVFLQYLPLDGELLGLETARLPLDGKVPIYRAGGQVIVHNTLQTALPGALTKDVAYDLGRQRIAAVVVRTADGVRVPAALYEVDFDLGTIVVPAASDLTGLLQPFTVHHRIEDELMLLRADISGKLDLVAGLTHAYPAGTSYVSSKLRKGDLFARSYNYVEQTAWSGVWSDELIGSEPTASFNSIDYPIEVTNRGAITERWAVIFTASTQVRVVGENVGQVLTGVSTTAPIAPLNPQTNAPYFEISELGWGGGWAAGNVLRFNTAAAGGPCWVARTVLQGPPSVASDAATIAFRADVDAA